ncbi:MAG: membrane protein [Candidatus Kapaibacterium sp.]|nr:MAG: membrane protein [Candidatus Kapabacteria bacterium]
MKSQQPTSPALLPATLLPRLERRTSAIAIATIAALVLVFLWKGIFGGSFISSDSLSSESFKPYLEQISKRGEFPLWVPYIFSGMPGYGALLVTGDRWWDVVSAVVFGIAKAIGSIFGSDTARVAFWYVLYGAGMYVLLRRKGHVPLIALISAVAAVFSTFVIVWVMIGHLTKPVALAMFPWILLGLESLRERWRLLEAVLLVVAVHVLIESTHLQMVFYGVCTFALYLLFELGSAVVRRQNVGGVLRAGVTLAVAAALSFGMAADRYLTTLEYTPYSTRGTAPISVRKNPDPAQQKKLDGNDYEYATNWSFSPEEMITFLVPNYFGFGKLDYHGPLTGGRTTKMMAYWGQMPFTDAANYMGILVLMLAIVGAWIYRREVFVQFLVVLGLFGLVLSFGKNFPLLYDAFYYHVPLFNKFRAPSMALVMLQFAVPILAAYGLRGIAERRSVKMVRTLLIIAGVWLVLGFIVPGMIESSYRQSVMASQQLAQYSPEIKTELARFVFSQMRSDWIVTAIVLILGCLLLLLWVRGALRPHWALLGVLVLVVADLWRVGYRPMEVAKGRTPERTFQRYDYVDFLRRDTSDYRIADFGALPVPNASAYYGLENIHGYHSAKLRIYQDLLDEAGNGGGSVIMNPFLWNLLGVKYILAERRMFEQSEPLFRSTTGALIYANPSALPRAFFVRHAAVASDVAILKRLQAGDFDPRDTVFLEQSLSCCSCPTR